MKKWIVYILRCRGGSLYTGITNDLKKRIAAHQAGKGAKYTRSHLPVRLIWHETVHSKSLAMRREAQIKKMRRKEKESLI